MKYNIKYLFKKNIVKIIYILICIQQPIFSIANSANTTYKKHNELQLTGSIQEFIHYVWRTHPAILAAQSEVEKANANFAQSRRPIYNPSLAVDIQKVPKDPSQDTFTSGISQTIDIYNKQGALASVGSLDLRRAKAKLEAEKLSIAVQTLKALAEYRMAQKAAMAAKQRTQLLRRFRDQNALEYKAGDITKNFLDQSALAYAEAISQQSDKELILIQAKQRLVALTETSPTIWPNLPPHLPMPLHLSNEKQKQWIECLPIISISNAEVASALAAIKVAQTQAKADPTINIIGGGNNEKFKDLLIGGGVSIPLFVRNNFKDTIYAANYQAISLEQTRMNVYRQAKAALQTSLSSYQILYTATHLWQKASEDSLNSGIELLDRLWSAGELSTTDYLVQLKQRIDSQIAGIELKGRAWQEWFSIIETSGQLVPWLSKYK